MSRSEFTKATKRLAKARSGDRCEAVGIVYGLEPGQRCNAPLDRGVEYDHYPLRACDGGDNSLDNCVAVCRKCHKHKTTKFDTPMAAKAKRNWDKANGIRPPSTLRTAGFPKAPKQRSATRKIEKWSLI